MTPTRTPEDYARDVGAAQVALDKAKRRLDVRNAIAAIAVAPISVDVSQTRIVVEFYSRANTVEVTELPADLTTRMHAAVADILADYLIQLENE